MRVPDAAQRAALAAWCAADPGSISGRCVPALRSSAKRRCTASGTRTHCFTLTLTSRGAGGVLLRLDPPRQRPAEIGQRRVRADREQLVVRIGVEHGLL